MTEGLILKLKRELEIINSAKKTIKSYIYYVENFLKFAEKKGLNENIVKNFIQKEINKKDPSTVSSEISAIKFFFKKVLNQELKLSYPKRNKHIPEILTAEEVKRLIDFTTNLKHKLMIQFLYSGGLRVSELINLKPKDIDITSS